MYFYFTNNDVMLCVPKRMALVISVFQINTFGGKCLPKTIWIPTTRENSERSELATFVCIWQSSHTSLGVF